VPAIDGSGKKARIPRCNPECEGCHVHVLSKEPQKIAKKTHHPIAGL